MFSHVHIGVSDFERAFAFYSPILSYLQLQLKFKEPDVPWAGWKLPDRDRPLFLIGQPFDGGDCTPGNGSMTAFLAPDRESVRRVYDLALENGAQSEGEPGLRPRYHENYYGAYFRDPDGNLVEVSNPL